MILFSQRARLRVGRGLLAVTAGWLVLSAAAHAQAAQDEFSVVGGRAAGGIDVVGAELGRSFGTWNFASCQTFAEADLEYWRAPDHGNAPGNLTTIGGLGGCRWWLTSRLGFDVGFGARILGHTQIVEDKQYSTAFQFQEGLGLRFNLDDTGHYFLTARARHISNGAIKHPNAGINTLLLSVGMTF